MRMVSFGLVSSGRLAITWGSARIDLFNPKKGGRYSIGIGCPTQVIPCNSMCISTVRVICIVMNTTLQHTASAMLPLCSLMNQND